MKTITMYGAFDDIDELIQYLDLLPERYSFEYEHNRAKNLMQEGDSLYKVTMRIEEIPQAINPADEYDPDVEEMRNA